MADFFDDLLKDNHQIMATRPATGRVVTFSNSGRAGKRNWFAMTTVQLSSCLIDMLVAIDEFPSTYEEKQWRALFSEFLTDDVARTMGAVQTLPLFEILAKIIHFANSSGDRTYKTINLDPTAIRQAIHLLSKA